MVENTNHSEDEFVPEEGAEQEDFEVEDAEELSADKVKKIREKLRASEKEKQEHLDGWQRARADFLNYKRRVEEDAKRSAEVHTARVADKLLPLLDSFALATRGPAWDGADTNFKAGFEMIQTQLTGILKDLKIEVVDPNGEPFNPYAHEAISERVVSEESAVGTIIETVQPGYKIGDTVIRPARVVVGKKA